MSARLSKPPPYTIMALSSCCPTLVKGMSCPLPLTQHEGLQAQEAQSLPLQHPGPRLSASTSWRQHRS